MALQRCLELSKSNGNSKWTFDKKSQWVLQLLRSKEASPPFQLLHREGKCEQEGFRGFMNCHGQSIAFCVVLLVASIPIAMPVVSTSTMALGSRALSSEGAIVTRLASIEEVAGMDMLCSDKTGTLTKNIMELQEDIPIFTKDVTREDVLMYAAMGAKWKEKWLVNT